jgi:hypothetical protein
MFFDEILPKAALARGASVAMMNLWGVRRDNGA